MLIERIWYKVILQQLIIHWERERERESEREGERERNISNISFVSSNPKIESLQPNTHFEANC